jgi:Tol biopolymer transport system component
MKRTRTRLAALLSSAVAVLLALVVTSPADATFYGRNGDIAFFRFTANDPDYVTDLFAVHPDGSGLFQLTSFGFGTFSEFPDYSPDGRTVAFQRYDFASDSTQLWLIDADGRNPRQLTAFPDGAYDPAFFPDGRTLAIDSFVAPDPGIFVIPAKSGTGAPLTAVSAQRVTRVTDGGFDSEPQVSPDGRWIVFTRYSVECAEEHPSDCQTRIFKVRTDGTQLTQLAGPELNASAPDWHPTGLAIAFDTHDNGLAPNAGHIMVMLADGSHKKVIVRGGADSFYNNPSFSPDGTRISYAKWPLLPDGINADTSEIWTAWVTGDGQRRVSSGALNDNKPDWGSRPPLGHDH